MLFVISIHSMGLFSERMEETSGLCLMRIEGGLLKIINTGVPLFLMLSGALLLGREESLRYFFSKRIRRILVPFIIWSFLVYAILAWLDGKRSMINILGMFIIRSFGADYYGIFWYVYLILGLYFLTPLLRKIVFYRTLSLYLCLLAFGYHYIHLVMPDFALFEFYYFKGVSAIGYFVAGYLVRSNLSILQKYKRLCLFALGGVWVIDILACIWNVNPESEPLMSVLLFIVLMTGEYSFSSKQYQYIGMGIIHFSKVSYGIYLTHFMIISALLKIPFIHALPIYIEPLTMVAIVGIIEFIVFYALSKVKYGKWLF